jgi:membrane protein insertase Oxa1/YidC/SpoIIIJ
MKAEIEDSQSKNTLKQCDETDNLQEFKLFQMIMEVLIFIVFSTERWAIVIYWMVKQLRRKLTPILGTEKQE